MKEKRIPDNCIIRIIDLPPGIGGATRVDIDGFVNIYVNARHGHAVQLLDAEHELKHMRNDDAFNDDDIDVVEQRAEGREQKLKDIPNLIRARDLLPKPAPPRKHIDWSNYKRVPLPERWDVPSDISDHDFVNLVCHHDCYTGEFYYTLA